MCEEPKKAEKMGKKVSIKNILKQSVVVPSTEEEVRTEVGKIIVLDEFSDRCGSDQGGFW